MSMPAGIATVTVTGRYVTPNGTALAGSVTFSAPALLTLSGADTIAGGSVTATLDASGAFSVVLIATDNAAAQPTNWTYAVVEALKDAVTNAVISSRSYNIALPQSTPAVDLADIAPATPGGGDYVLVTGPAGRTILNGTTAPTSGIGTAGDFYINTSTWTIYGPKTTTWPAGVTLGGGGGGTVTSVNGKTPTGGAVTLVPGDIGADVSGAATTAQTNAATYTDTKTSAEVTRADGAYLHKEGNLSELTDPAAARGTLGLTSTATKSVGTTSGTVAAGDDSRIANAVSKLDLRRRDLPDASLIDSLYTGTAPVYTLAQTTTPTTGYLKYAPVGVAITGTDTTGPFVYAGAGDFQIGATSPDTNYVLPTSKVPHTYANSQGAWSIEFGTDAQIFQVRFKYMTTTASFRLTVDGRKVTELPNVLSSMTGIGAAGNGHMLTVDLGSAAPRRIRFDFNGVPFGGVYLPPTAVLWGGPLRGQRFGVLCDSIGDGSTNNAGGGTGTWIDRFGRMMGYTDVWRQGRGGTGYITAGSWDTFPNRVAADVVAYNFDELVIAGGYNDSGGAQDAIGTACDNTFNAVKAGLPNCRVIVVGCWAPTGTAGAGQAATDETIRARAAAAGFPFVSSITGNVYNAAGALVAAQGKWITGTGHTTGTAGNGNADFYVGADSLHPSDAGHAYMARRMYAARTALMSQ